MASPAYRPTITFGSSLGHAAFALALICALTPAMTKSAQAQTFTVLHSFTGGADGSHPSAGLSIDQAGNFYGTTSDGGAVASCYSCGVAFLLGHSGSGWVLTPIYEFRGPQAGDGQLPQARVIFGPDGALYGTTYGGGAGYGGTVFRLSPPPTTCRSTLCYWKETILHSFKTGSTGPHDGFSPGTGDVMFDPSGNLFGTTMTGGDYDSEQCPEEPCGTVYEISHAGGQWQESVIYEFTVNIGWAPAAGVIRDSANNLYGTTTDDGAGGTVYQLVPGNGRWAENTLYSSFNNPAYAEGGLIFDPAGNLYGTYASGGTGEGGIAFELVHSGNSWNFTVLYNFINLQGGGWGPLSSLTMDAAGNLYGTTYTDGANSCGSVFKLTPSNGSWTYTSLHDFSCDSGGAYPISNVTFDSAGNLYGTALGGGQTSCFEGCGVIWEITP